MPDLFTELTWRGFVHHATQEIGAHLAAAPRTVYCGFDPTAPSLQLGNLMPIMLLRHFQLAGHKPIVLMGGGTGLIGDPSGKRSERPLLSKEQIREHLQRQRDQMARLLDFDGPACTCFASGTAPSRSEAVISGGTSPRGSISFAAWREGKRTGWWRHW